MQRVSLCYSMHKVKVFHDAASIVTPPIATWPTTDRIHLRASLMREESRETLDGHFGHFAADQKEPGMSILDGCLDTIVVVAGTMLELGCLDLMNHPHNEATDEDSIPAFYPKQYTVKDACEVFALTNALTSYMLWTAPSKNVIGGGTYFMGGQQEIVIQRMAVHTVKACVDIISDLGVCPKRAFDIVCAANDRKIGPDGKCVKRADGKILKPEGWYGPEAELQQLFDERNAA